MNTLLSWPPMPQAGRQSWAMSHCDRGLVVVVMTSPSGTAYMGGQRGPEEMRNSTRLWIWRDLSLSRGSLQVNQQHQSTEGRVIAASRAISLKVNLANYAEIIFVNKRQKSAAQLPPPFHNITHVSQSWRYWVWHLLTVYLLLSTFKLQSICAHTPSMLYKFCLWSHGLDDISLQTIYCSVVTAKLTHASSAWWGFTSAADWQRLDAFITRRSQWCRFVPSNLPSLAKLCDVADNKLFNQIISNSKHVPHGLLLPLSAASQNYNLRQRKIQT